MPIATIIQLVLALPKIISALNSFFKTLNDRAIAKEQLAHDEAIRKLQDAKNEEDQKNALRDIVKHP